MLRERRIVVLNTMLLEYVHYIHLDIKYEIRKGLRHSRHELGSLLGVLQSDLLATLTLTLTPALERLEGLREAQHHRHAGETHAQGEKKRSSSQLHHLPTSCLGRRIEYEVSFIRLGTSHVPGSSFRWPSITRSLPCQNLLGETGIQ